MSKPLRPKTATEQRLRGALRLLAFGLAWLALSHHVVAATRATASYRIVADSLDHGGGAAYSASYAQRAAVEPVAGFSAATIPDATARFIYHGFVPQLDPPLFPAADLAVTLTASPILSSPQEVVTYAGRVANRGAEAAPGVVLVATLPANLTFNSMSSSQGNSSIAGHQLRCEFGTIPAGGEATFSIVTTAGANGAALVAVEIASGPDDPHPANNTATALSTVVTAVRFVRPGGGSWNAPGNWSPAVVPGPDHKVFIDDDIVDFYDTDATVAGLSLTGGRIGGARRLTVTTLAEWSGGELQSGATLVIPPGGTLRVANGNAVGLRGGSGIENHGTVRLESTALQGVFGAWVTNSGLFEIVGNRSFLRFENTGFDFHNRPGATFRRLAGPGTNSVPVAFRNDGLVEVLEGTLDFNAFFINGGYSLINRGTLRAAAGTEMRYTKANLFEHGTAFEGPGLHRIIAATMGPVDGSRFAGAIKGDFEIANGLIDGSFTHTGHLLWTGGLLRGGDSLTTTPGSQLTVAGAGNRTLLFGYAIQNFGTVRLAGANLDQSGGGIVDNHGLFDIAGDFGLLNGLVLTNRSGATLRKSAGPGTTTANLARFHHDGLLELHTGTFALAGDYSPGANAGLRVYLGGTIPGTQFSRLTVAGTATLNGALQVEYTEGYAPGAGDSLAIVSAARRVGEFGSFAAAASPGPLTFTPAYLASEVVLRPVSAALKLLPPLRVGNGLKIVLDGTPGENLVLEASTALGPLADWKPVVTNLLSKPNFEFLDPDLRLFPARFYRARRP